MRARSVMFPEVAEDAQTMRSARNAVAYEGRKNSLVEWTLSPEWEEIPAARPQDPISGEFEAR